MLLLLGWILRIEGWLMLVLGLIFAIAFTFVVPGALGGGPGGILGGPLGAIVVFLMAVGAALWFALPVLVGAELIFLLARIDKNTRDMADAIQRRD